MDDATVITSTNQDSQPGEAAAQTDLERFIDQLLEDKNYPNLTDAIRQEMHRDLMQRVSDSLNAKIIAHMNDTQAETFEKMLDDGESDEAIQAYAESTLDDPSTFIAAALMDFRREYLGHS